MHKTFICLISLLLFLTAGSSAQERLLLPVSGECNRWVDSVMNRLTPDERLAQLFMPRLDVTDNAAGHAALLKTIVNQKMGGYLLGKGTLSGYTSLIADARKNAAVMPLVALDGEWGLAMRVSDAPRFPYNMGLGATTQTDALYDYGREVARQCRAVGINVCFAPVLDVNSNPANPVIGYRSFGENPERVAKLGVAYSHGLEDGGVLSVAKHFPGHGDTSTDSHKTLPTVDHSFEQLQTTDLVPFRRYAEAGLSGIMTAHLRVPALDPSGTPASLSPIITTDFLKGLLEFDGLVFTDALAMKGAVAKPGQNNCVAALLAGADVLLQPVSPAADMAAVKAAIADGTLTQKRIDESCRKILTYKYRLGAARQSDAVSPSEVKKVVTSGNADAVNQRLARASITVLKNSAGTLPLSTDAAKIAVVSIGSEASNAFSRMIANYAPTENFTVGQSGLTAATLAAVKKADAVVVGVFTDAQWARTAYAKLAELPRTAAVFFVNPFRMAHFSGIAAQPTVVVAYDDTPALRSAAAQALFGGFTVDGRFPVNVKGVGNVGDGVTLGKLQLSYATPEAVGVASKLNSRIDSIVRAAIAAGAFPGCQVVVARRGEVIHSKAYGKKATGGTEPVTPTTLYDIASMTKATATLGGVMKAYDEQLFALDDKLSDYVPGMDTPDKRDLRVSEFLFHESGMPAVIPINKIFMDTATYSGALTRGRARAPYTIKIGRGVYGNANARLRRDLTSASKTDEFPVEIAKGLYGIADVRDTVMNRIYQAPLRASKRYFYSCLNFCLLMEMEENLTGVSHEEWVEQQLFKPLGATRTLFRPTRRFAASEIAPTERDPFLRHQTLRGYVHDEIAAFSGGVQGNAGLFSTATDIAKYAQMLLNRGEFAGKRILSEATVDRFTTARSNSGLRALGFDLLTSQKGLDDGGPSDATYGHTGFTGTCFWIDPDNDLLFVFLSNRVNPSRDNPAFTRLNPRQAIINAIYDSLLQR